MTAPDDLIRRDTAERAIRARQRDTEDSGIYAGLSVALQELAALPADPVAEAAGKLAEAVKPPRKSSMVNGYSWCAICQRAVSEESVPPRLHATGCEWVAYRAAVAARAKEAERSAGTSPNDRLVTPKLAVAARSAGTVPPAPKPAPACARCGGSGYLCPVCSRSECFQGAPCPECRGKP